MSDWRKPAEIIDVEPSEERLVMFPDRTMRQDVSLIVTRDTLNRMREGRLCLICTEPQQHPFPKQCSLCGYRMRDRQTEDLAKEYQGDVRVGSRLKLQDEIDRMTEFDEYERRTGMLIPDSVRNRSGAV